LVPKALRRSKAPPLKRALCQQRLAQINARLADLKVEKLQAGAEKKSKKKAA